MGPGFGCSERVWHDTLTLFKNCVAVEPRSPEAHSALAGTYFAVGRPREAEAEARLAMEIDPACANAYTNLSYFSKQTGKLDQAIDYLEQATRAVPLDGMTRVGLATVHLNLGLLCSERKDFVCAEQHVVLSTQLGTARLAGITLASITSARDDTRKRVRCTSELRSICPRDTPRYIARSGLHGKVYDKLTRRARSMRNTCISRHRMLRIERTCRIASRGCRGNLSSQMHGPNRFSIAAAASRL